MRNWFTFDNYISKDYGVYISGLNTFGAAERDVDSIQVPGRNGELTIDNGRYHNIEVIYPAFIYDAFDMNVSAFRNILITNSGYKRLEDTYHPDEYRLARFTGEFDPDVVRTLRAGQFDLTFSCYPQRFLKKGDIGIDFTADGSLRNDYLTTALPKIRAYGTGSFTIGDISVAVESVNSYIDIDCELQEAYEDTLATPRNDKITLTDGEFPKLLPGVNTISFTDLTELIITPKWWIL